MNFEQISKKLVQFFNKMVEYPLFRVSLPNSIDENGNDTTGYVLGRLYINSFKPEDNPIFRDPNSSIHNCNLDLQFIKNYGNVVAIIGDKVVTMWDCIENDVTNPYFPSFNNMSKALKTGKIVEKFVETFDKLHSANYQKTSKNLETFQLGMHLSSLKIYNIEEAGKYESDLAVLKDKLVRLNEERVKHSNNTEMFKEFQNEIESLTSHWKVQPFKPVQYKHYHVFIPKTLVDFSGKSKESILGLQKSNQDVFKRTLDIIPTEVFQRVTELIDEGLYNGIAHTEKINYFLRLSQQYQEVENKEIFTWLNFDKTPYSSFKNESIGTLCVFLAEGWELSTKILEGYIPERYNKENLESAEYKLYKKIIQEYGTKYDLNEVKEFIVAEGIEDWLNREDSSRKHNSQKVFTEAQKKIALQKLFELGYGEDSFIRRLAKPSDITVENIVATLGSNNKVASIFDKVGEPTKKEISKEMLENLPNVSLEEFIQMLPDVKECEVYIENKHINNLCVLHTATNAESKNILSTDHPFAYTFKQGFSGKSLTKIDKAVQSAGGNIEGWLCCSLIWNDEDTKGYCDLDVHFINISGSVNIYYGKKECPITKGTLDVDMRYPTSIGVENIVIPGILPDGEYIVFVRNYSHEYNNGFKFQIKHQGVNYSYEYLKKLSTKQDIPVARMIAKKGSITFDHKLPEKVKEIVQTVWGITTKTFQKVNLFCLSPNYWGNNNVGNKHFMFMLENLKVDEPIKGLHSEFLKAELKQKPVKQLIENLGNKSMIEVTDGPHLGGLGFNITSPEKENIIVKTKNNNGKSHIFNLNFYQK